MIKLPLNSISELINVLPQGIFCACNVDIHLTNRLGIYLIGTNEVKGEFRLILIDLMSIRVISDLKLIASIVSPILWTGLVDLYVGIDISGSLTLPFEIKDRRGYKLEFSIFNEELQATKYRYGHYYAKVIREIEHIYALADSMCTLRYSLKSLGLSEYTCQRELSNQRRLLRDSINKFRDQYPIDFIKAD